MGVVSHLSACQLETACLVIVALGQFGKFKSCRQRVRCI